MNFSTIHALRREQIIYVFLKVCLGRHAASVHQITKNRRQVNQRKDKVFPRGVRISWRNPDVQKQFKTTARLRFHSM